jgi:hypothetical protein
MNFPLKILAIGNEMTPYITVNIFSSAIVQLVYSIYLLSTDMEVAFSRARVSKSAFY